MLQHRKTVTMFVCVILLSIALYYIDGPHQQVIFVNIIFINLFLIDSSED